MTFTTQDPLNEGEKGFQSFGSMGCNGLGGGYLLHDNNGLTFEETAMTTMLCGEAGRMESEELWSKYMPKITSYAINDNQLQLTANDGAMFVFEAEEAISAETQIQRTTIQSWGDNALLITDPVFNSAITRDAILTVPAIMDDAEQIDSLINTLFNAQTTDPHTFGFPNGTPPTITQAELNDIFSAGEKSGWEQIEALYPGTDLIIGFSKAGILDDYALIYYEIKHPDSTAGYISFRNRSNDTWRGGSGGVIWQGQSPN